MIEAIADHGYYENERPEIARLVPATARVILDVGCGKGRLGEMLKRAAQERKVYGIEYHPSIAQEAGKVLDGVLVGDIQTMTIDFAPEFFDCIIFADVLEHVIDPAGALIRLRPHLKKDGAVLCSIPNIRHYTAIMKVIKGWDYDDYGIFDRTHLRFFSLKSMQRLLGDAGFVVEHVQPRIAASKKMRVLNTLLLGALNDFLAMQYLLLARPSR